MLSSLCREGIYLGIVQCIELAPQELISNQSENHTCTAFYCFHRRTFSLHNLCALILSSLWYERVGSVTLKIIQWKMGYVKTRRASSVL